MMKIRSFLPLGILLGIMLLGSSMKAMAQTPSNAVIPADTAVATGSKCDSGPFGPGHWPPGCWRPYADSSPFNTPLPENPQLIDNSPAIVNRVLSFGNQPANLIAPLDGTGGWPTYWATADDPLYTVRCLKFGGECTISFKDGFHAPAGAVVQGGCVAPLDTDRHLTVIDQTTGWEYDLWQVRTCPLPPKGGLIEISWGGHTRIDGIGVSEDVGEGTASHFGNLAGRIREEEFDEAVRNDSLINHALTVAIRCSNGQTVFPAADNPGTVCPPEIRNDAPPMGARFQLNMTYDEIEALGPRVPIWKKVMLRTLATYGMFMNDTGSTFYFSWQTESGNQYTSMGYPDRWLAFAMANNWKWFDPDQDYVGTWHNTDEGINWREQVWSRLRVIHPCVSEGTCPPVEEDGVLKSK